jgi:nitrate reductase gamma subunit
MLKEDRLVWANRFVFSGLIIILIGFYLLQLLVPYCPIGVPDWNYRNTMAIRVLMLYTIAGILLIILGLILCFRRLCDIGIINYIMDCRQMDVLQNPSLQ